MNFRTLSLILTFSAALVGCGDRENQKDASTRRLCTQEARSGMSISVPVPAGVGAAQFASELRGAVSVDSDLWNLTASFSQDGKTATLFGAWEAVGTLSVQLRYRTAFGRIDDVVVESDGCHTRGAALSAAISGNTISFTRLR